MSDPYRVTAEICDDQGRIAKVSFIVRSGAGWKWAVDQAHDHLADQQVIGDVSVDQIWPDPEAEQ